MRGSEFAALYGPQGFARWELAAIELAKSGGSVQWPWMDVALAHGDDTAIVKVTSDAFAIGTADDFLRLPLTPKTAQVIANLNGCLLPTPWLVYQSWKQADLRLTPKSEAPNRGANMAQYAAHNQAIQAQLGGRTGSVRGVKKSLVVSNIMKPGKVVIFGWYLPMPDVFTNGLKMGAPGRQPIQPNSNYHGDFYVDYSHGVYFFHPVAKVNGRDMELASLYQHPTLSSLVSNEGPIRTPRYPAPNNPPPGTSHVASAPLFIPQFPSHADMGLQKVISDYVLKRQS
jgi:hypothetical protein